MTLVSGSGADGLVIQTGDPLEVVSGGVVTDTTVEGTGDGSIDEEVAGGTTEATAISAAPDWRRLLGRADSPWYPGHRLLRQGPDRSWHPVAERAAHDLAAAFPRRAA